MGALSRFQQGIRALTAWARPVDMALVESVLSPAEVALFRRLRRSEQLHSIRVLRAVMAAGETTPALLVAALLHDVGKTVAPFTLPDRVLVVLARKFMPQAFTRWGQDAEPRGWRRPFAISLRHPEWSAEMLAAAGSDPLAVALARRHADPLADPPHDETERLLAVLRAADDAN